MLTFILAAFLAFYIPGNILIRKLNLSGLSELTLSIITGFVLWSLAGFLFGYAGVRNLMYVYLAASFIVWVTRRPRLTLTLPDFRISVLILLGTVVQLSSVFLNGIPRGSGLYFCCGVPDTITHLALTNELTKRFPPNEPGVAGVPLVNYHYLSNLATADLIRIFRLPLIATQYQYLTVLFSLLLGLAALALSEALNKSKRFTAWLLFFLYFAGDIIYLLPAIAGRGFNFSVTTLENASTLWISPPRFFALVVLLGGLAVFAHWLKKKNLFSAIIMAIILGSLIGFKVYVGLFVLAGFAALFLIQPSVPILLMIAISLFLYIPVNTSAGGLVFSGFWRFEDFVVQPALGISRMELARRVFLDHFNYIRAYAYDIYFGFLYIVFSAGTLLIGFIQPKKPFPKEFSVVLIAGLIATSIAGFFFLQKTGGANSSQFLISIYVVGAIFTAAAVSGKKLPILIALAIISLTATRVIHDGYIRVRNISTGFGATETNDALTAFQFLATTKPDSIVLVYNDFHPDCLFVAALGNRTPYLCTIGQPGVLGDDILAKKTAVQEVIFFGKDVARAQQALRDNHISYIYIPSGNVTNTNIPNLHLSKAFASNTIEIYNAP